MGQMRTATGGKTPEKNPPRGKTITQKKKERNEDDVDEEDEEEDDEEEEEEGGGNRNEEKEKKRAARGQIGWKKTPATKCPRAVSKSFHLQPIGFA